MGPKLRFLRRKRTQHQNRYLFLNDAPRPPPIPVAERISDASSADFTDISQDSSCQLRVSQASQDNLCLICLDDVPAECPRTKLPCAHGTWHTECITKWLRRCPRCPLCNKQVSGRTTCYRGNFSGEGWRLVERRGHEEGRDAVEHLDDVTRFATHDLAWLLLERRLSSIRRPPRTPRLQRPPRQPSTRRFCRSVSLRR